MKVLQELHVNFPLYARKCLKIRLKKAVLNPETGIKEKIVPFILNKAQEHIHFKLEQQSKDKGYVRALLLKGRQQGCSTYVEGRFYWKTSQRKGVKAFILTHEDKATSNIFKMAKRYYEHCPAHMQPHIALNNAKELTFDRLDSAYGVGTAGSGDVGRSDTIDFFHGSEVGFWKNTDSIKTGVMQAAEMADEIILESTANGLGNMFHHMWQDAAAGKGKYIAIFVPWYWQEEYREPLPDGFTMTDEEEQYYDAYYDDGLTDPEQIMWRRNKIIELKDPSLFKQEYPGTAAEAFQTTGHESLISPEIVLRNRKTTGVAGYGAYVVGCDPAREGDDATTFIRRQGRIMFRLEKFYKLNDMAKAGRAKHILDNEPVDRMFIDRGGGSGMYDRLKEMGYGKRIKLVNFGGAALNKDKYYNRRTEMWCLMGEWMSSDEVTQVPDDDGFQADVCSPGFEYTSSNQKKLERKRDIKKRLKKSPDEGDAGALTFAEPVNIEDTELADSEPGATHRPSSGWAR